MITARWLLSEDGQAFLEALAKLVGAEEASAVSSIAGNGDFTQVEDAFLHGVVRAAGGSIDASIAARLRARLSQAYEMRFNAVSAEPGFDMNLCLQQAEELGKFTYGVFLIEADPHSTFPQHPAVPKLDVQHLEWARDVIGFLMWGRDTGKAKLKWPPADRVDFRIEQFDNGCTLC